MTHSPTLLIVEDDTESAEIIQKLLDRSRKMSFQFLRSETLAGAIDYIKEQSIDIILLDLDLPDSQGLDTFRQINREAMDAPIIIMSSHDDESIATTAISEGAQDYLVKNQLNSKALEHAILYAMARKNNESSMREYATHLIIQFRVATALAEANNLNNATHRILKAICEISKWQIGEIWAVDQHDKTLRQVSSWIEKIDGQPSEYIDHDRVFHLGEGIPGHIWETQAAYWASDLSNDKFTRREGLPNLPGVKSCFGFPILFQNEVLGVMLFFCNDARHPDSHFLSLFASIGSQIGTFIKRKRIEGDLLYLAQHDALTGLANRVVLEDNLNNAISQAKRLHHAVALLYLDLDHFKKINDTQSHAMGDLLLREVSKRLHSVIRSTDTLARLGGDEFAIVLTTVKTNENVIIIAKKILYLLSMPFIIHHKEFHITASIGISMYPNDGDSVEMLLKNADIAMYHAKEKGRNNYQFCPPNLESITQQRIQIENELHYALKKNEFVLYYQPIIDIKTGKVISLEALIRWNRLDKKDISPSQFIPIAEQSNLILSLGNWIIRTACVQTKLFHQLGIKSVSVNVSANQLNMGMIAIIRDILNETNFDPNMLVLEITEGTLMQETESNLYILNALKELGIRLSIDDFGVGYSSLSYLKHFSVFSIKIDRSFITHIPTDTNSMAIVSAIIAMAHSLNIKTIAEGVETQEQLDFLRSKDCDRYQGFFFSEAVSAEDLEKLLTP